MIPAEIVLELESLIVLLVTALMGHLILSSTTPWTP